MSKQAFQLAGVAIATSLFMGALSAQASSERLTEKPPVAKPPAAYKLNLSCDKRGANVAEAKKAKVTGEALLIAGIKGKPFALSEDAAYSTMDQVLTSHYNLREPLATIKDERARRAIGLVAQLLMNDYVIAAQMAFGAVLQAAPVKPTTLQMIRNMVFTAIEPYAGDEELTRIAEDITKADQILMSMNLQPRQFARWVARAAAFEDAIAMDAAMTGFCAVNPTSKDFEVLKKAVDVTKLKRNSKAVKRESVGHNH